MSRQDSGPGSTSQASNGADDGSDNGNNAESYVKFVPRISVGPPSPSGSLAGLASVIFNDDTRRGSSDETRSEIRSGRPLTRLFSRLRSGTSLSRDREKSRPRRRSASFTSLPRRSSTDESASSSTERLPNSSSVSTPGISAAGQRKTGNADGNRSRSGSTTGLAPVVSSRQSEHTMQLDASHAPTSFDPEVTAQPIAFTSEPISSALPSPLETESTNPFADSIMPFQAEISASELASVPVNDANLANQSFSPSATPTIPPTPSRRQSAAVSAMTTSSSTVSYSSPSTFGEEEMDPGRRSSYKDTLRHAALPKNAQPTPGERWFIRVYRTDRSFGTFACTPDSTADAILRLAARKFFVDHSTCRLELVTAEAVRNVHPESYPVRILEDMLERAGYTSRDFQMRDVCREDITFLGRLYLVGSNPEGSLLPITAEHHRAIGADPIHIQLCDVDACALPSQISPGRVESLDVSFSAFTDLDSRVMPYLRHLSARCVCIGGDLAPPPRWLMSFHQVQTLDLSGNALCELPVDFTHFRQLTYIKLNGNCLDKLPSSLAGVRTLRRIGVGSNCLTSFDVWSEGLREVDISFNMLTTLAGIAASPRLEKLVVSGNQLKSSGLPQEIATLAYLSDVDLRFNLLESVPMSLFPAAIQEFGCLDASENHPSATEVRTPLREKTLKPGVVLKGVRALRWQPDVAALSKTRRLDLSHAALFMLDDELVDQISGLEELDLGFNALRRLPPSLGGLGSLRVLAVNGNSLASLPAEIGSLTSLEILDVRANNLKLLPSQMWQLPKLRILNASSNLLQALPEFAEPLRALKELYVADNRLDDAFINDVGALPNLQVLNVSHNELTELPPGMFAAMAHLRELYVSGNRLSTLPHEDFESAGALKVLFANSNRLHTLPAELAKASRLEMLDVSANSLRYNISNWPYDWNWRWNTNLRYLNFSANRRLEIRRSLGWRDMDLSDFTVLPKLAVLGLIDVTLTTSGVPEQTEHCRVRTYGGELSTCRVSVADCLGESPLSINDLVIDRFRDVEDEALIGLFDGHPAQYTGGNKISHLSQANFAQTFKRELSRNQDGVDGALRRSYLALHRDIGNTALLEPEEIAHSFLGHHSNAATHLRHQDQRTSSGATVLYLRGKTLHIASSGGANVVVSRATGEHRLLASPQNLTREEMMRIRRGGVSVDPTTGKIGLTPKTSSHFTRLIGGYVAGSMVSAEPIITSYELKDPHDVIVVASAEVWRYVMIETAADIVRGAALLDPALAALKLRDLAVAYGLRTRAMVVVLCPGGWMSCSGTHTPSLMSSASTPAASTAPSLQLQLHPANTALRRFTADTADSRLARLGSEVAPPTGEVTMVFTDIRRSTMLWETVPSVMRAAIQTHNTVMRRSMRLMEGYEVKNEGDAFVVSFATPALALAWCLAVQQQLLRADWPPELFQVPECAPIYDSQDNLLMRGLSVRMGAHCGRPVAEPDPITMRMDYFGPMVNRTARISGIARGGQIAISSDLMRTINKAYDAGNTLMLAPLSTQPYTVEEVGELKLRGIENAEHIFALYPASLKGRHSWYAEEESSTPARAGVLSPTSTNNAAIAAAVTSDSVLSALCHRLEVQCCLLSGGDSSHLELRSSDRGSLEMWVTRIENSLARLNELLPAPDPVDVTMLSMAERPS